MLSFCPPENVSFYLLNKSLKVLYGSYAEGFYFFYSNCSQSMERSHKWLILVHKVLVQLNLQQRYKIIVWKQHFLKIIRLSFFLLFIKLLILCALKKIWNFANFWVFLVKIEILLFFWKETNNKILNAAKMEFYGIRFLRYSLRRICQFFQSNKFSEFFSSEYWNFLFLFSGLNSESTNANIIEVKRYSEG